MEKVLIIGGTGFIGKNIIRVLKEHNVITGCYDLVDKNYGDYNYIGNVIYDNDLDSIISEYDKLKGVLQTLEKLIDEYELGKYDYSVPVFILKDKLKELKEE